MADVATIYGKDNLTVVVSVTEGEGQGAPEMDLTGFSVDAAASKASSAAIAATSTEVTDAANGEITVKFASDTFKDKAGAYTCHVRATSGENRQTVSVFTFTVLAAIYVPA